MLQQQHMHSVNWFHICWKRVLRGEIQTKLSPKLVPRSEREMGRIVAVRLSEQIIWGHEHASVYECARDKEHGNVQWRRQSIENTHCAEQPIKNNTNKKKPSYKADVLTHHKCVHTSNTKWHLEHLSQLINWNVNRTMNWTTEHILLQLVRGLHSIFISTRGFNLFYQGLDYQMLNPLFVIT